MKKFVILFVVLACSVIGVVALQEQAQTGMEIIEEVPPPTAHPLNQDTVQKQVNQFETERKRLEEEGKNKIIHTSGIESLGADLRPLIDLQLPETVYMDGRTISHICRKGDAVCNGMELPAYHFMSIDTDTVYTIDSNLKEYFSGDLSEEEKDREREHFAGILDQLTNAIGHATSESKEGL